MNKAKCNIRFVEAIENVLREFGDPLADVVRLAHLRSDDVLFLVPQPVATGADLSACPLCQVHCDVASLRLSSAAVRCGHVPPACCPAQTSAQPCDGDSRANEGKSIDTYIYMRCIYTNCPPALTRNET